VDREGCWLRIELEMKRRHGDEEMGFQIRPELEIKGRDFKEGASLALE